MAPFGPRKPFVSLSIGGFAAAGFLGGGLREFTYTDTHHGQVDEIAFTMADAGGTWRMGWGPDEGTQLTAVMGYEGLLGGVMPCGLYAVDEAEASGDSGGDVATFRALSAFTSQELRTDRSAAYDEMTLADIVAEVAGRHGLAQMGEIPELFFTRISQNKESDLAFLTRLASDWGCYTSVKGDTLVFASRESIEGQPPARWFELAAGDPTTRWALRRSTKDLYPKAELKFLDPKTKQVITATAEDDRVPSGDTLKLDDRVETQAQADRRVFARLAAANDKLGTGQLTMVGDPLLVAGQVILLGASYGRYAGRWLVTQGEHRFASNGYTTSIEVKLI